MTASTTEPVVHSGPRISIPPHGGSVLTRAFTLRPEMAVAPAAMSKAAYELSILPTRVREAVRMRIAQLNGCLICQNYIDAELRATGIDEEFYASLPQFRDADIYTDSEKAAIALAEAFSLEWDKPQDELFAELKRHYDDAQLLDLTFCVARHVALGRMTHMLGLDAECEYTYGFNLDPAYEGRRSTQ